MPTDDSHPESSCARCAGPNVTWWAPSPLWNEVMRGGDINGADEFSGIVCPTCFAVLAEERGIAEFWRLGAERVHVDLQTTTPSGRTWDAQTQLWQDPPAISPAGTLRGEVVKLAVAAQARTKALQQMADKIRRRATELQDRAEAQAGVPQGRGDDHPFVLAMELAARIVEEKTDAT